MQSERLELSNLKTRRRGTAFVIGVVLSCVFLVAGILALIAYVIAYYPLWLFSVILFIAGIFLLMVELVLVYVLITGKQYGFQSEDVEEADD